jgi:phosphoribosylanthranilate isomerase
MSLWIKICATTSLEDARIAVEAGANAVGFVFAVSPRRVSAESVAAIVAHLPTTIETIGVFVDAGFETVANTVQSCRLTGVQLHSEAGPEFTAKLRDRFGAGLRVLRVVHFGANASEQAAAIDRDPNIDAVLVDSRTAAVVGGTGIAFDWGAARNTIFLGTNGHKPRIAAGGLSPSNVAEAIATLRPWGVDVVSGVEAAPGVKDAAKVRAFIANGRAAAVGS